MRYTKNMKRILSGVKPSGQATLGNYLGAFKRWVADQERGECLFFIPNLHALTARQDPRVLKHNTLKTAAWLVASGIDPKRSIIFAQSQVPAHAELSWILSNYTTMGELNRMTQFKDKSQKAGSEGQLVGLYTYPVLMAADILLYDADEVPVGDDQKQHVELTRDIAARFNNLYGETFRLPQPTIGEIGARLMNLQDPSSKMSKSDTDDSGNLLLEDDPEALRKKIMRAVTDSGSAVEAADDKPAVTNMLQIMAVITGKSVVELEAEYVGKGYGDFKTALADAVVQELEPVQQAFHELMGNEAKLTAVLDEGAAKAKALAEPKLQQVKERLGLI